MVSALGFSMQGGRLTAVTDLFADPFWHHVRDQVAAKAMEMRRQGFFGPAMLPMSELEYRFTMILYSINIDDIKLHKVKILARKDTS
jgi:fructose 1,6-bisphosphatase